MNFKLISVAAALAISAAVAQESEEEVAALADESAAVESSEESASASTAEQSSAAQSFAEEVPAATESSELALDAVTDTAKANFDILRGRAYNTVGNQAAASTIADHIAKPHEMHGSKLVYLEPTLEYAALAFGENNSYFLSFQNTAGLGKLTAGYATAAFGVEVYASIGKTWSFRDEPNIESSDELVLNGDDVGAVYSMPLGSEYDLTVAVDWYTLNNENSHEADTRNPNNHTEDEEDYWDFSITGTISNTPAKEKLFSWAAGLTILRHNITQTEINGNNETDRATLDSRIQLEPFFNLGFQVLKTNNARVFLGLNSRLPIAIYDDISANATYVRKDHVSLGLLTTPNILAELALNDNWMVFGGASYDWNIGSMEYLYEADADITAFGMRSNRVNVNAGARFQYKNFALEASIADAFFSNPLAGFNGTAFIATLGGFINF